jgi:putative N6-adenine-specific DNA methylase
MTSKRKKDKLFAVTAPGLEPFTALELRQSSLLPPSPDLVQPPGWSDDDKHIEAGGVAFRGRLKVVYKANLSLRTANRILLRLGEFYAAAFSELRKKAGRLEWERFLRPGQPVAIRVTCRKSRLYHSDAVAERVAGAIGDRLGQSNPLGKFNDDDFGNLPQLIIVRLFRDFCTINIDTSGALLHRRGYHLETAKAPLRETLAAGMLLACGWDRNSPLLDPFCGSGTIPIEAALMARGLPAGGERYFSFMNWPNYDPFLWQECLEELDVNQSVETAIILGSDRDAGAIEVAKGNAERAGVANDIEFTCLPISAINPPGTGWIVTNPPYGIRVSENKNLRNLYAQFGNVLRSKCPGWQVGILCNDYKLLGNTGLKLDTSLTLDNGGIPVKLGRGKVDIH